LPLQAVEQIFACLPPSIPETGVLAGNHKIKREHALMEALWRADPSFPLIFAVSRAQGATLGGRKIPPLTKSVTIAVEPVTAP